MKQNRRSRSKRNKFKYKFSKFVPYLVAGLFIITLSGTQFFYLFYQNQKDTYEKHVSHETVLSSIFDFSNPGDFIELISNLQKYFAEIMTNLDLNQLYSFLNDGFAFINMGGPSSNAVAATQGDAHGYKYTYVGESLDLQERPQMTTTDPYIYLFNSHDTEEYESGVVNASFGRVVSVVDAAYIMAEELEAQGIKTLVESRSTAKLLQEQKWSYVSSYKASRMYLEETASQYDTLKYFIDIHRDDIPYKSSVVNIDGKPYAKVMFVVGVENERYSQNLAVVEELEAMVSDKYPGLSRGFRKSGGAGNNGVYNQDFATTLLLVEIGGQHNTYEEIANTSKVIAQVVAEYAQQHQ